MAIQYAINRLAAAVERNQLGVAVTEIIRQRDAWQAESKRHETSASFANVRAENYRARWETEMRKNRALRGVITRMKKAKS